MSAAGEIAGSIDVPRPAEEVWPLIADVTAMARLSPECRAMEWLDGATGPAVGVRFRGRNRRGPLRWQTTATVTACEPGRRFAFRVQAGPLQVAEWAYELTPTAEGCRVRESTVDRRGRLLRWGTYPAMPDRAGINRRGIEETLARLRATALGDRT
ncbi:MAG: hypothetical protein JWM67_417 [Mycobacterium sp.]|nr:hypothetical protein [Mycobacterium sp.]